MDKMIIVTANLGYFKAYRITKNDLDISPRVELVDSHDYVEGHTRLSEQLTDTVGRFNRGGGKDESAKGAGERHTIESENEKRIIKTIAKDIDALIKSEGSNKWCLASGKKINRSIIDNLAKDVKSKLHKNVTADLIKIDKSEILNHFV